MKLNNKEMKIENIYSLRTFEKRTWFQIVYEWEDIFAEKLNCRVVGKYSSFLFANSIERIVSKLHLIDFLSLIVFRKVTLAFQMTASSTRTLYNNKNIIPYIIDFWLSKEDIPAFEKAYSKNPLVIVSSKQVYDFLILNKCRIPIIHIPLSIPDKYIPKSLIYTKKYDVALIGRISPIFLGFFDKYVEKHPNTSFIKGGSRNGNCLFHDNKGIFVSNSSSQESYLEFLKESRCVFYSTPGIDGDRKDTNGFSQVTPKFLEYLSCGCYIIMRYQDNSDVRYYDIPKYWSNIENYEQFEEVLDNIISEKCDMTHYMEILDKHSTSKSVELLLAQIKDR